MTVEIQEMVYQIWLGFLNILHKCTKFSQSRTQNEVHRRYNPDWLQYKLRERDLVECKYRNIGISTGQLPNLAHWLDTKERYKLIWRVLIAV